MTVLQATITSNIDQFMDEYRNEIDSHYMGDDFVQVWFNAPVEITSEYDWFLNEK